MPLLTHCWLRFAQVRMARPNAIPMGAALVGFGAYGARHSVNTAAGVASKLLLGMLLTIIVTCGSMLINDYHDFKLGVDNEITKPGCVLTLV